MFNIVIVEVIKYLQMKRFFLFCVVMTSKVTKSGRRRNPKNLYGVGRQ